MTKQRILLGKKGEKKAIKFLTDIGYKILERNYKSRLGEIDIVAKEGDYLCFVEVRTGTSLSSGEPLESILKNKQHKLAKIALSYLKEHHLLCHQKSRFDVVSVLLSPHNTGEVRLIRNAFPLDSLYLY